MSRAKNSSEQIDVQLFPFVAVLLCTMGSLLVLLVITTRSAKVHATEAAAAARAATAAKSAISPAEAEAVKKELSQIAAYRSQLDAMRAKAAEKLRQDQQRLSHLEDHMQRLRTQLESLQLAAAELNTLEGDHYDDRQQAEREIARLQQLIEESRKTIADLRAEARQRSKHYAIVPYQGRQGTFRRPIYIECREDEVILQPEGVTLTIDDFRPPIGPGNPLVAAIRAAREYIARNELKDATGKEAVPYPLIVVRPEGVRMYYGVREAIQSWDSEFGYELVEEDWELNYGPADPQLATLEYQAAELARNRLRALAAAAPQAYGAYRRFGDDEDDDEELPRRVMHGQQSTMGRRGAGGAFVVTDRGGMGSQPGGDTLVGSTSRTGEFLPGVGTGSDGDALVGGQSAELAASGQSNGVHPSTTNGGAGSSDKGGAEQARSKPSTDDRYAAKADPQAASSPEAEGSVGPAGAAPPPGSTAGGSAGSSDAEQQLDRMARQAAAGDSNNGSTRRTATKVRGKDWAIADAGPGMIPIRRTIQIVVRKDAVTLVPEWTATGEMTAVGREVPFQNSPADAYEDTLTALEKRIKDWGMAGDGLYWRPVVELHVEADGERRVDRLTQLLKRGGFDVRSGTVARQDEGGTSGAQR